MALSDFFNNATVSTRPDAGALTAQKLIAASSITVDTTAGWPVSPDSVHFIIYQVDASGNKVAGTQTDWKGTVTSSTAIGSLTLKAGTDQIYPVGSKVIATPTGAWADDMVTGLLVAHDQDGTLKAGAVDNTAVLADSIVTRGKLDATLTTEINTDWKAGILPAVNSVSNNGNRSYDITFASTVASLLSPGMRLRTTRTVTAPTQCADLESGSSQYFNKTSPNKLTFADDFVVSAWVKLESYPGAGVIIASRYNGTSGWYLNITASGTVVLAGINAGAANSSYVISYQSIPLGKWVHIAAQLDMSAFTATTTTSYVMIDGVDVPAQVVRTGTNPTALIQAGNLEIGSFNGGTLPFDGKIAQVAIYSAKVTQANIRATIAQGISGSETSLASAYSFNNSIADLNTTTPNDLTANAGAVATTADSPFGQDSNGVTAGTTDYALVMKVSTTTATVQVPEGCTIPTSGGVSAVAYSTATSPFGFTLDKERWAGRYILKANNDKTSAITIGTYYNINGNNFTLPIGSGWDIRGIASGVVTHAGVTYLATTIALSTSASTLVDERLATSVHFSNASLVENNIRYSAFTGTLTAATATPVYVLNWTNQSATTLLRTSFMDVTYIPAGI